MEIWKYGLIPDLFYVIMLSFVRMMNNCHSYNRFDNADTIGN